MYLYAGKLVLQGQRPFVDFFDINPPLIVYISAVFVWMAERIPTEPIFLYKALIYFFSIFCTGLGIFIAFKKDFFKFLEASGFAVFLFAYMIFSIYYGDFGQRDYILGFSLIPYLFLRLSRMSKDEIKMNPVLYYLVGFIFGLSVALKPYFLMYFLGYEFFLYFALGLPLKQWFTPEVMTAFAIQAIYYIYLIFMPDPAGSFFWRKHIPDVLNYYSSFDTGRDQLLAPGVYFWGMLLCVVAMASNWRHLEKMGKALFVLSTISLAVFLMQMRWFPYHLIPTQILLVLNLFYYLFIFSKKNENLNFSILLKKFPVFVFVFLFNMPGNRNQKSREFTEISNFVRPYVARGDAILPLSPNNSPYFTLMAVLDLKLGSKFLFQYPLNFFFGRRFKSGKLYFDPQDEKLSADEKEYFESLYGDIEKTKPKVIWYRQRLYIQDEPSSESFPMRAYLSKVGFLKFLEKDYRPEPAPLDYLVFVRK